VSLAVFAAWGIVTVQQITSQRWLKLFLSTSLLSLVLLESLSIPLPLRETSQFDGELYNWIKAQPQDTVILELPNGNSHGRDREYDTRYMLAATYHHQPLANGYSGVFPKDFLQNMGQFSQHFPSAGKIELARQLGINIAIFHRDELNTTETKNVQRIYDYPEELEVLRDDREIIILRIKPQDEIS